MAYELSNDELTRRFASHILSGLLAGDPQPQTQPRVVIVAGQPGAGKSYTERSVVADLGVNSFMAIDPDDLRPFHPDYHRLAQADDRTADSHTVGASRIWNTMALRHAAEHRFNIVWSTALTGIDVSDWASRFFRNRGYHIDLAVVGVDDLRSKLGVLHRYQRGRDAIGTGRLVSFDYHDLVYASLPHTLADIETRGLVDSLHIYNRAGNPLYRNAFDGSHRRQTPTASQALTIARSAAWTPEEVSAFVSTAGWLGRHPRTDPATQPHLLPQHACSPLATDLRPVLAKVVYHAADRLRAAQTATTIHTAFPSPGARHTPLQLRRALPERSGGIDRRHQTDADQPQR